MSRWGNVVWWATCVLIIISIFVVGIMTVVAVVSNSKTRHIDNSYIVVEEDGSGEQYDQDGNRLRVFDHDTFIWLCTEMGDKSCGPSR